MIYMKTRLKKVPKTCAKCPYSSFDPFFTGGRNCRIALKDCPVEVSDSGQIRYGKPSWCPLVDDKELKPIEKVEK